MSFATLFAADPDWSQPPKERTQYLTQILTVWNGGEQRVSLRTQPRTQFTFQVLTTEARDTAALDALIWGQQARLFTIPFWPDAQALTAQVNAGDTVVMVNTAQRKFQPGGMVAFWRDMYTAEVCGILSVAADRITLNSGALKDWAADGCTRIVPALTGYMSQQQNVQRLSNYLSSSEFTFKCIGAPDVTPGAVTQYAGFDVWEIEPNAATDRTHEYNRVVYQLDAATGTMDVHDKGGVALVHPTRYSWLMESRNEVDQYREFVAKRRGALVPVWVPSWKHDLILKNPVAADFAALTVEGIGYASNMLNDAARCHLALIMPDGSKIYRKVIGAASNVDGTETLTLNSAPGKALTPGLCMISFLMLCRLASDEPALDWHTTDCAEASLDFVELPFEVPA